MAVGWLPITEEATVGAAHAEAISNPKDLDLPPEVFGVLLDALTEQGQASFTRELVEAIATAQRKNNLRPVHDVLEAWYRTLVVRQHDDYRAAMTWARTSQEREAVPVDEFFKELSV